MQTGAVLSDPKRFKFEGHEHYLKTADEMRYLFREVPEACDNTLWIAERAEVEIEFGAPQLPNFPLPEGFTDDTDYLAHVTWEGVRERWGDDIPESTKPRVQYELDIIAAMGFSSYFLIVWDLIKHARDARHPRRPRPRVGGRAAPSPTACGSPTSTRSATTCCSSASSTRAASRCPTSTWTSTPATGTR